MHSISYLNMTRFCSFSAMLCILGQALAPSELQSKPRPGPLDFEGQVRILRAILKEQSPRYRLLPVDLFESKQSYKTRANSSMLDDRRYVFKKPEHSAFQLEMRLIRRYQPAAGAERSLFIHTAFEIPGRQAYQLLLTKSVILPGQLTRASIWVYSNHYAHRLDFLFQNANGARIRVHGPTLSWYGWRRLELDLPASLYHRGHRIDHRYKHSFLGFVIQSSSRARAGAINIGLDNFLIMSDFQELNYPGTEFDDIWK